LVGYILRRLGETIIVVILLSMLAFLLIHMLPGDPALMLLGMDAAPEQVTALRTELWLDRPILVQYGHWLSNVFQGDLGNSITYRESISGLLATRWPITLYLSGVALFFSVIFGIFFGIISAIRRASFVDNIISLFANTGVAIPVFWLGILGIYLLGYKAGWLPIQGFIWPNEDLVKSLKTIVMPVICLAVPGIAVLTRQTRSSMLEVIQQDYIRTARAKGLAERVVTVKHALKNALIPVVTLLGLQVRVLVGGSVIVETVFNIPGMGRLLVTSAFNKDFLVVQSEVLIIGAIVCLVNLLVDISYGWVDPRIRY
jgi:peptide/nickel transport system permease protein